jgi:stalled ribosome alternative rescue factor ArfA
MKLNTPKLRSVFTSGMNLGNQIHRPKKGKGSYSRKNKQFLLSQIYT